MADGVRLSLARAKVLQAFLDEPTKPQYGYALTRATGVKSGTLYPILEQFERAGWLRSYWERLDPGAAGRPPRRSYELTAEGLHAAPQALADYVADLPVSVWDARLRPGDLR